MNLNTTKCQSCNAIVQLPHARSRHARCEACWRSAHERAHSDCPPYTMTTDWEAAEHYGEFGMISNGEQRAYTLREARLDAKARAVVEREKDDHAKHVQAYQEAAGKAEAAPGMAEHVAEHQRLWEASRGCCVADVVDITGTFDGDRTTIHLSLSNGMVCAVGLWFLRDRLSSEDETRLMRGAEAQVMLRGGKVVDIQVA